MTLATVGATDIFGYEKLGWARERKEKKGKVEGGLEGNDRREGGDGEYGSLWDRDC